MKRNMIKFSAMENVNMGPGAKHCIWWTTVTDFGQILTST